MKGTELFNTLSFIHKKLLSNFTYKTDKEHYGVLEKWVQPDDNFSVNTPFTGDCEDFALAARKLLNEKDIKTRLVFCKDETGAGHLVLEAYGWILDNRQFKVVSNSFLQKKGYEFLKISGYDSGATWHILKPLTVKN